MALWSNSLGLPASYGTTPVPLIQAAAPEAVAAHVALVAGTWPGRPVRGRPIPAAIPAAVATRLKLSTGDILPVRDRTSGARLRLRLTGLFRLVGPAAPYWNLDLIGTVGTDRVGGFITYCPVVVDPAAFSSGQLSVGQASWIAIPRTARIGDSSLRPIAAKVTHMESFLEKSPRFGGLQVTTNLPGVLTGLAASLVVARSLLAIGALQLLLVAMAAVTLATRLLAGQRAAESALLSARGGSRWQLARLDTAEILPIACISVAAGGVDADHIQGLSNRLNRAVGESFSGAEALGASAHILLRTVTLTSGLLSPLAGFLGTQAAVQTVLALLFTGLAVLGAIALRRRTPAGRPPTARSSTPCSTARGGYSCHVR